MLKHRLCSRRTSTTASQRENDRAHEDFTNLENTRDTMLALRAAKAADFVDSSHPLQNLRSLARRITLPHTPTTTNEALPFLDRRSLWLRHELKQCD